MKLKGKILAIAILPLIMLGVLTMYIVSLTVESILVEEIGKNLESSAISLRDAIEMDTDGDYTVDENGELYKGDFQVSYSTSLMDNVKNDTGIVMTVFFGDTRYVTSVTDDNGNRAVGTKASDRIIEEVLVKGNTVLDSDVNVNGIPHMAFYLPIYNQGDNKTPVGMVFAGDKQEVIEKRIKDINMEVVKVLVILIVACSFLVFLFASRITRAINKALKVVEEVSKGNLTVSIPPKFLRRRDEIGKISKAISELAISLLGSMKNIKQQSDTLHNTAIVLSDSAYTTTNSMAEVETSVNEIASGAHIQAEETQSVSGNVVLIGNMIELASEEATELQANAKEMKSNSIAASDTLAELDQTSKRSKASIEEIYTQTLTTNESALKIKEATNLIAEIAAETNLLSLNATIEAARAGEQGRGFAVVAAQIKKLAEQSNESAKQIEIIINSLIGDSQKAVTIMEEVKGIVSEQNESVEKAESIFGTIIKEIEQSIQGVNSIVGHTDNMDTARVSVVDSVQNLTAVAEESAASTEVTAVSVEQVSTTVSEISGSAAQLKEIAAGLEGTLAMFQIG